MLDIEIRLHAVTEDVPLDELRAFYKADECPVLDAILERSPSVRLGNTEVTVPENQGARGPVGRVDDLLSLRGTSTWPQMDLPRLDENLRRDLMAAFEARPGDPTFDVLQISRLAEFLSAHLGSRLAAKSRLLE